DSVEFSWEPKREAWQVMLSRLREWKGLHGHCNVSGKHGKLGGFVSNCRRQKRNGEISPARVAEVDALGFEWREDEYEHVDEKWARKYHLLKRFFQEGDRDLEGADEKLRLWATNQRGKKKAGILDPHRERLLDAIGFRWVLSERRLLRP